MTVPADFLRGFQGPSLEVLFNKSVNMARANSTHVGDMPFTAKACDSSTKGN